MPARGFHGRPTLPRSVVTPFALAFAFALALSGSTGSASASQQLVEPSFEVLNLPVNDLAYDPKSDRIYASVPGRAGSLGNRIVTIDPDTGALGPAVFVGSEPFDLAISPDGEYLYVALFGAFAVRRVHLPTFTAGLQFSLGSDPFHGPYYAEDIEVVPGNSGAVAVSLARASVSPRHGGVAIFDEGAMLPDKTADHTGSNAITFDTVTRKVWPPVATLYGYNSETTEFGFRRMTVRGQSGVVTTDVAQDLISGFNVDIKFEEGRLYASSGRVIDPRTRTPLGTYTGYPGPVEPDSANGKVYFVSSGKLAEFDLDEYTFTQATSIPGLAGSPWSLIEIGGGDLAFRTTADQVFLVRFPPGPLPPPGSAGAPAPSAPTAVGSDDLLEVARAWRRWLRDRR